MKRPFENSKQFFRPRLMGATQLRACLGVLLMTASLAQAGKPGGVAVLLPIFVPVQAPQLYLPSETPFDMLGFMQSATVDTPTDYFSAGWMEVNGLKIRVPRNTIFQMPATQMTWADMFMNAPAAYLKLGQSGLAISDTPKPLTTYEVHVIGNRVVNPTAGTDQYVAGLIYISQQGLNVGQGIINAIDYSLCTTVGVPCMPDIWVGSTLTAKTGARLRLNTPKGRYGAVDVNLTNGIADRRFTSDEDNPTIVARTGYPMCIPRFDPAVGTDSLCPQWNRPTDPFTRAFSVNYTFAAASAGAPDANGITHQVGFATNSQTVKPDPFEQTPMEVGDNISYTGSLVQDVTPCAVGAPSSSCQYISAHTVVVELGLYTAPSTWPVYTYSEQFVFGVAGTPNPIFPQEAVEKIFGDFFTTDSTQLMDIYSEDINSTNTPVGSPNTPLLSHRFYGTSDPFGPPLGGLKGRARFRVTIGNFLPPTRNLVMASRAMTGGAPLDSLLSTAKLCANGLKAGYYSAPQFGFIFPENLILGSLQIPLTFQEFPFLANGSGPYVPFLAPDGTPSAGNIGQLLPWPGVNAPPAQTGSTGLTLIQPPVANAGPAQTVPAGSTVNLSAAASTDSPLNVPALPLIYTWQQLSGPVVTLQNANTMLPTQTFVAPTLAAGAAPVVISIQLAVCNGFTCGGATTVNVTVVAAAGAPNVTLSASQTVNIATGSTVTLNAATSCNGGVCATAPAFTQIGGPNQIMTGTGLSRSFKATLPAGTPLPAALTFSAKETNLGSVSTATITVYVGADVITVTNVVYQLAHSKLQVAAATNALPKGSATLTVTPLVNNKVVGPDIVCTYDPILDSYNVLASITNPIPDSVRIKSSAGAVIVSPLTRIL
jgi:hypothetical protein